MRQAGGRMERGRGRMGQGVGWSGAGGRVGAGKGLW